MTLIQLLAILEGALGTVVSRIIIATLFFALGGCAATHQMQNSDTLTPSEGVLIAVLQTNWEGHRNPLLASLELFFKNPMESRLTYRKLAFEGADHLVVANLPSAMYEFVKIRLGNRSADLKEGATFEIHPGKATYIGSITIDLDLGLFSAAAIINSQDDYDAVVARFRKQYPDISDGKEIVRFPINLETED